MHKRISCLILSIFLALSACSLQSEKKHGYSEIDDFQVTLDKEFDTQDWTCVNAQYDEVCFPSKWKVVEQTKYLFLSQLADTDENTYFVVLRYEMGISKVNIDAYLTEVQRQLSSDTVEVMLDYKLTELIFSNEERAVFAELDTRVKEMKYKAFAIYYEFNGLLYDLTLKTSFNSESVDYQIFQNVLYNYKTQGTHLFPINESIKAFRPIVLD